MDKLAPKFKFKLSPNIEFIDFQIFQNIFSRNELIIIFYMSRHLLLGGHD